MIGKKILPALLLAILIFYIPNYAEASSLNKFQYNPVLNPDQPYDNQGVSSSGSIFLNNKFYMYYTGYDGQKNTINLAISLDGINWTKNPNNPLIVADSNNTSICEKGVHDPDVIYDQTTSLFKMWYVANCEPKSTGEPRYWIKYAESTNGINWSITNSPVLSPTNQWEIEGVTWPTVIKKNNQYLMWYAGRNSSGLWQIGRAISTDGKNWQKDAQPNISPSKPWENNIIGGPDIIFNGNKYTLFYHQNVLYADSIDSLNWTKPNDNPLLSRQGDENLLWSPDVVDIPNNRLFYYSVLINNKWYINLASEQPITLPPSKPKLIIIPGLFGSWNKEAMLHNATVNPSDWKLNPIVKEYDGIIDSLKNIGYQENNDFYVFPYDWRQPIANSANNLNSFITQKLPDSNTKFSILAHSEGGLVARTYAQQQGADRIYKIVTVGSPHQGTAATYKGVEAGDVDPDNALDFMAKKLVLQINKDNFFESDRKRLNTIVPVLKDFLPTYDFLTNAANQPIPISSMNLKNDFLLGLQNTFESLFSKLATFYGEKNDTLWGFTVGARTNFDKFFDIYPDGHPTKKLFNSGDNLIVSTSAGVGNDVTKLNNKNHGEIVTDIDSISQLFTKLGIPYQNNQLVSGHETKIFPGLLFLIQSPGIMHVSYNNSQVDEKDGMIFIENAPSGLYTLKIQGTQVGDYTIRVGQFIDNTVIWDNFVGSIDEPSNEIDTYKINFDNQNPRPHIINQNNPLALFDALITILNNINKNASNKSVNAAINSLQNAKKYYAEANKSKLILELQNCHSHLFQSLKGIDNVSLYQLVLAVEKFENLYDVALAPFAFTPDTSGVAQALTGFRLLVDKSYERLLALKSKGNDITVPTMFLQSIENKLETGKMAINNKNSRLVTIIIQSIGQLLILVNNFK